MGTWKDLLNADPTDWLLEKDNPSVRYFALRDLFDLPETDEQVQAAREEIMKTGLVPEILEIQKDPAYKQKYPAYYTDKYKGLIWSLIALAEMGAAPIEQIREQCEYLLDHSQERLDGGFSMHEAVKIGGGRINEVVPCLAGNMVWSLIHFGYLNDDRLQRGIGWLIKFMRLNDGAEENPQAAPYDKLEACWGKHTCHMGVVKAMKALGEIPKESRSTQMEATLSACVEFMLIHHIYKRSHDLGRTAKPGWLKFGFPMMYQTDVLEVLDILAANGIKDSRMEEAVELVLAKQDALGRWSMENAYTSDRMLVSFGRQGEPNKWITLKALRVLKRYAG